MQSLPMVLDIPANAQKLLRDALGLKDTHSPNWNVIDHGISAK